MNSSFKARAFASASAVCFVLGCGNASSPIDGAAGASASGGTAAAGSGAVAGSGGSSGNAPSGGSAQGGAQPHGGSSGTGGGSSHGGSNTQGGGGAQGGAPPHGGGAGSGGAALAGSGGASGGGVAGGATGGTAGGPSAGAGGSATGTMAEVQAIFDDRCTNCHDATKHGLPSYPDLPLTAGAAHDALVNQPGLEGCGPLVKPGDPDHSYLLHKVSDATPCSGQRMPRPFEVGPSVPLTDAQIATIRGWIAAGAPR